MWTSPSNNRMCRLSFVIRNGCSKPNRRGWGDVWWYSPRVCFYLWWLEESSIGTAWNRPSSTVSLWSCSQIHYTHRSQSEGAVTHIPIFRLAHIDYRLPLPFIIILFLLRVTHHSHSACETFGVFVKIAEVYINLQELQEFISVFYIYIYITSVTWKRPVREQKTSWNAKVQGPVKADKSHTLILMKIKLCYTYFQVNDNFQNMFKLNHNVTWRSLLIQFCESMLIFTILIKRLTIPSQV